MLSFLPKIVISRQYCYILLSLFEKWSTLDPKNVYAIHFQKLVFLISLYPKFLEKNQRNKKSLFLVNSHYFWSILTVFGQFSLFLVNSHCFWSILTAFVSPSMLI